VIQPVFAMSASALLAESMLPESGRSDALLGANGWAAGSRLQSEATANQRTRFLSEASANARQQPSVAANIETTYVGSDVHAALGKALGETRVRRLPDPPEEVLPMTGGDVQDGGSSSSNASPRLQCAKRAGQILMAVGRSSECDDSINLPMQGSTHIPHRPQSSTNQAATSLSNNTPGFTGPGPVPASWGTQAIDGTQRENTHVYTTTRTWSPAPSTLPQEPSTMGIQGRGFPLRAAAALPDDGISPPWAPTTDHACNEVSSSESNIEEGSPPNCPGYTEWQMRQRRHSEAVRIASHQQASSHSALAAEPYVLPRGSVGTPAADWWPEDDEGALGQGNGSAADQDALWRELEEVEDQLAAAQQILHPPCQATEDMGSGPSRHLAEPAATYLRQPIPQREPSAQARGCAGALRARSSPPSVEVYPRAKGLQQRQQGATTRVQETRVCNKYSQAGRRTPEWSMSTRVRPAKLPPPPRNLCLAHTNRVHTPLPSRLRMPSNDSEASPQQSRSRRGRCITKQNRHAIPAEPQAQQCQSQSPRTPRTPTQQRQWTSESARLMASWPSVPSSRMRPTKKRAPNKQTSAGQMVTFGGAEAFGSVLGSAKGRQVFVGFRNARGERDGYGVMRNEDGTIYAGQWVANRREGRGTVFFAGGVFEAEWVHGDAQGEGMVHFKNGDVFRGQYAGNQKCGHGVYRWSDGAEETGQYVRGQKHGRHRWRFGSEQWELVYGQGSVVSAQRHPARIETNTELVTPVRPTSSASAEVLRYDPNNAGAQATPISRLQFG